MVLTGTIQQYDAKTLSFSVGQEYFWDLNNDTLTGYKRLNPSVGTERSKMHSERKAFSKQQQQQQQSNTQKTYKFTRQCAKHVQSVRRRRRRPSLLGSVAAASGTGRWFVAAEIHAATLLLVLWRCRRISFGQLLSCTHRQCRNYSAHHTAIL